MGYGSFHCLTSSPINNYRPKRKEEQTRKKMEPCWRCKNTYTTLVVIAYVKNYQKEKNYFAYWYKMNLVAYW